MGLKEDLRLLRNFGKENKVLGEEKLRQEIADHIKKVNGFCRQIIKDHQQESGHCSLCVTDWPCDAVKLAKLVLDEE